MLVCEEQNDIVKVPICDGMDLEDIKLLRKNALMFKEQEISMKEMKLASGNISEEERKKLGW